MCVTWPESQIRELLDWTDQNYKIIDQSNDRFCDKAVTWLTIRIVNKIFSTFFPSEILDSLSHMIMSGVNMNVF